MSICTNILFLRILSLVQTSLQILRFVVPLGLVIKIAIDFYKNITLNDPSKHKENRDNAIRRIVAGIIVFLIPTFVNTFMYFIENITGQSYDYQGCLSDIENINYYIELANKENELKDLQEQEKLLKEYEALRSDALNFFKSNLTNTVNADGTMLGVKYNLTESELEDIAKICQQEQGSARGAAWEASLMANRFELFGSKYGNLHNYVLTCRWWAPANKGTYKNAKLKPEILNSVRQVLIEGQRQVPLYVDEHDWTGDITKIVTNGKTQSGGAIKNHTNFQKDTTVIYNRMGAIYTYYGHPTENADPFGYTAKAKSLVDSMS